MKKKLLIKAICHNWDLMGPGSWKTVKWKIFDDGSFLKVTKYNYNRLEEHSVAELIKGRDEVENGHIPQEVYQRIKNILDEEWIDNSIDSKACDGEAWEITCFKQTGEIVKKIDLRYVYGQPIERLSNILNNLPLTLLDY